MAVWTTQPTVVAGQLMTAAFWNTYVRDDATYLYDRHVSGLWTPVIGGSTGTALQTYSAQTGLYDRVGSLVYASYYVVLTAKGTIGGNVQIQGLPIASYATGTNFLSKVGWSNTVTSFVFLQGELAAGATAITVQGITAAATSSENSLTTADIANNTNLFGTVVYRATA